MGDLGNGSPTTEPEGLKSSGGHNHWWDLFSKKSSEFLIAGILSVLAIAGWGLWDNFINFLRGFIVQTTSEELARPNNRLQEGLKRTIENLRQSEVGALTVGNFSLNSLNNSYTVFVYFPDGYTGSISYQLEGEIIPNKRFVVVAFPSGEVKMLRNLDGVIDIAASIKAKPATLDHVVEQDHNKFEVADQRIRALASLRGYTFQLIERASPNEIASQSRQQSSDLTGISQTKPATEIRVSYVALIAPAIRFEK